MIELLKKKKVKQIEEYKMSNHETKIMIGVTKPLSFFSQVDLQLKEDSPTYDVHIAIQYCFLPGQN